MKTILTAIKSGKTSQASALIERTLMTKTLEFIEEEKKKATAAAFGGELPEAYGSNAALDARIASLQKQIALGDPGGAKRAALKKLMAQKSQIGS